MAPLRFHTSTREILHGANYLPPREYPATGIPDSATGIPDSGMTIPVPGTLNPALDNSGLMKALPFDPNNAICVQLD